MDNKSFFGKAGVMLAYPLAYLYLRLLIQYIPIVGDDVKWFFPITCSIFVLLYIVWNELVLRSRGKITGREGYFWYGTMLITAATSSIAPSPLLSVFAIHLCAVYCVLVSNGILYEGKTGRYILLDLLNGGFVKSIPNMGRLFSDMKTFKETEAADGAPKDRSGRVAGIVMIIALFPVFVIVLCLLSSLNEAFEDMLTGFLDNLNLNWIFRNFGQIIARLIFSVPISLFLYGLLSSCASSDGEAEKKACERMQAGRSGRQKVAAAVGGSIILIFDLIYLLFFILEGKYLFGGLTGVLPEGYSVCSYARSGFFELLAIMTINMGLYLVIRCFCRRKDTEDNGPFVKWGLTVLLAQSVLFSLLSFSKIFMYFYEYGYTPKRMLSMWATLVMAAGSLFLIRTLFRKKDLSGIWIFFTTVSYIVICVLSGVLSIFF